MAGRSKLSDAQWDEIRRRLLAGEKAADLAREFGVHRAAISRGVAQQAQQVKTVANQLLKAEENLRALPIPQQNEALTLLDELKAISTHMARGAKYSAATYHRLAGMANGKLMEIDDANPLANPDALKAVVVLQESANKAAVTPINLLAANKDAVKKVNDGGADPALDPLSLEQIAQIGRDLNERI